MCICTLTSQLHDKRNRYFSVRMLYTVKRVACVEMFSFMSTFTQAVVESVAPLLRTNVEQLQNIWQKIEIAYQQAIIASETDGFMLNSSLFYAAKFDVLASSKLSDLLGQFVQLMIMDELEFEKTIFEKTNGENHDSHFLLCPCAKYFVENGLIDKLYSFGLANV